MNRAFALVAGLILATQIASQSAAAMELPSVNSPTVQQRDRSPSPRPNPGHLPGSGTLSAGPAADLKVELYSAEWDGNDRRALFYIKNTGNATAESVHYVWTNSYLSVYEGTPAEVHFDKLIGHLDPGQEDKIEVICEYTSPFKCSNIEFKATTESVEQSTKNNTAVDEV